MAARGNEYCTLCGVFHIIGLHLSQEELDAQYDGENDGPAGDFLADYWSTVYRGKV